MERGNLPDIASEADAPETAAREAACPPAEAPPAVTVFICTTCRGAGTEGSVPAEGTDLAVAACAMPVPGIAVQGVRCLANCKRALSAAMVRRDGWTYVFGDLSADAAPDLMEGARLLAAAPDGLMPWRDRPASLKRGMIARIPPLTLPKETR